jgi:hypothetical protein
MHNYHGRKTNTEIDLSIAYYEPFSEDFFRIGV